MTSNLREETMIELIEKTLLTGMGALSLSQKKTEELIQELKTRLNVTEEEGKELLTRMRETARENQEKLAEVARQEVHATCERLGVVTAEEFEKLRKKVLKLEKDLRGLGK